MNNRLTVRELQALLKPMDQDAYVVMPGDQEGIRYDYICGIKEDMALDSDNDEFVFLGQYNDLEEIEEQYEGDELAFFSVAILYP